MRVDPNDPIMMEYDYIDSFVEELESKAFITFTDLKKVIGMCVKDENFYNKFNNLPITYKTFILPEYETSFGSLRSSWDERDRQTMAMNELVPESVRVELILRGLIEID